jgi:hypothetical protein
MESTASTGSGNGVRDFLALVPIAAALLLSGLSWIGICTDDCVEMHLYRLFGVPLPPFGAGFFALLGLAFLARRRFKFAGSAVSVLLAGALGSELVFVWIQKFVIGRWCSLCIGIAVSVVAACALFAWERLQGMAAPIGSEDRSAVMKRLAWKTFVILVAFVGGMTISAIGMKRPNAFSAALAAFSADSVAFGDAGSSSELYVVTDWFCPACRKAEPEIAKGATLAMRRAKVIFVDYPIHQETHNYIPYNLSFMIREKDKYLRIREALASLAQKTKEPTPDDVQAAVSGLGVKYVPLNYLDVMGGVTYFESVIRKLQVPGTPSVVVLDSQTGKKKILTGSAALTADRILQALSEVSGK